MDWSDPTMTVVPSLDGAVLAVLAGVDEALTGREVHRRARRGSAMGVYRALIRLEKQGVVDAVEAAPSRLYRLNREHVAAPVALALVNLRGLMFARIREDLAAWLVQPVCAAVFGSVARGDGGVGSDVDVLLVRPDSVADDEEPWATQVDELARRILRWCGNPASMLQMSIADVDDLISRQEPVVDSLMSDAIDVAGTPIRELLAVRGGQS